MSAPKAGAATGERRIVTALFADVVGSTSIAETMDPEDWGELVGRAVSAIGAVATRYGGTVAEFAGDAVLAVFGAPIAHEDDPYRAVSAGLEIVAGSGSPAEAGGLEVRVGINTGLALVSDVESGAVRTVAALGDTMNVASRLQSLASPGTVAISEQTRRLLGPHVDAIALGSTQLKGRREPVEVFRVVSVLEAEERGRGVPGLSSPMIGRDAQLRQLVGLTQESAAGLGRVAVLLGEPGVGKSRLIDELGSDLRATGAGTWVVGRCVPFDQELPFQLAASVVRSVAGVGTGQSPEADEGAVRALAARAGATEEAGALLRMVGLSGTEDVASPETLVETYVKALTAVVSAVARAGPPLVIVLEDAHWADASSVDVIGRMLAEIPGLPVLVIIASRPERDSHGWSLIDRTRRELGQSCIDVHLDPLPVSDLRDVLGHLLEVESLPVALRRLVTDRVGGNPFFLEETVRMLIDRGLVDRLDGRWVATAAVDSVDVPDTVQGLLAARIDQLPPAARRAGRFAAVIGRTFTAQLFSEVYEGEGGAAVHPDLASLESSGLLVLESTSPHVRFAFRHALIHDVMYEGMLRRERQQIHRSVADTLEQLHPDRRDELSAVLAHHHELAGSPEPALHYVFVAARRADAQGARVEAAEFYGHAQALLAAHEVGTRADRVDAVLGRLRAGSTFIPGPDALGWIDEVLPIARDLDDPDRLAALYERAIWTRGMQGEGYANGAYREQLDEAYALMPTLRQTATAALLQAMWATAQRSVDAFDESLEPLAAAVDALERSGELANASEFSTMLADSFAELGRFSEASAAIDRATQLAARSGDLNAAADADLIRGSIAAERGDLDEAIEYLKRGVDGAQDVGNTFCDLVGNFKVADQQLRTGNAEAAIAHLEHSAGLARYCNAGGYEALGQAWLAAARARLGDLRPQDFDAPLEHALAAGSRSTEAKIRVQRATALAAAGDLEGAIPDFDRALELEAEYGGRPLLARTHHAYGEALRAAGRNSLAASQLDAAAELFAELGMTSQ